MKKVVICAMILLMLVGCTRSDGQSVGQFFGGLVGSLDSDAAVSVTPDVTATPVATATVTPAPAATPTPTPTVSGTPVPGTPTPSVTDPAGEKDILAQEVGEPVDCAQADERLIVAGNYPETGLSYLDKAITAWIKETEEACRGELERFETLSQPGELTFGYESHQVDEARISVKLQSTFTAAYLVEPVYGVQTFNADKSRKKLLDIEDVLNKNERKEFKALLAEKMTFDEEMTEEELFTHFVLTDSGVEVLIEQESGELTRIFIAYSEMGSTLEKAFQYQPVVTPSPEPLVTPIPQQTTAPRPVDREIDPNKPMLALTFDDGPGGHTARLLNAFEKYGGKGTFFLVGEYINSGKKVVQRMADEGHEIGNHSWNHKQLTKLSETAIANQITKTNNQIYKVTGQQCTLVRPPYGDYNKTVGKVGKELGVTFVNWSVDTLDWKYKNADTVYNKIMKQAKDGAIILCHDIHKTTVDAMERAIPALIEQGYQLVTVSELMSYSKTPMEAGKLYYKR